METMSIIRTFFLTVKEWTFNILIELKSKMHYLIRSELEYSNNLNKSRSFADKLHKSIIKYIINNKLGLLKF